MKKFASLFLAVLLIALLCSCGTSTKNTIAKAAMVDTQGLEYHNELIVFNGETFEHRYEVLDYTPKTALSLIDGYLGVFAQLEYNDETGETIGNYMIKSNGEIVKLSSHLGIIPREKTFNFSGPHDDQVMIFSLALDDASYDLTIHRSRDDDDITVHGVVDAWTSYHRAYWMVGHTVYVLDWDDASAKPEVYISGDMVRAVSHHKDEAEGAIVSSPYSNWSAYGWQHILSPYGGGA